VSASVSEIVPKLSPPKLQSGRVCTVMHWPLASISEPGV
jgi:hypothetical protein